MTRKVVESTSLVKWGTIALVVLTLGCESPIHDTGPDARADYEWGTLGATLDYPLNLAFPAAKQALRELDVTILVDEQDDLAGQLLARDAHDETITIELEALPRSRTQMKIRVGSFGDKNKSSVIFTRIMENLR
jgi:hypothetical protein